MLLTRYVCFLSNFVSKIGAYIAYLVQGTLSVQYETYLFYDIRLYYSVIFRCVTVQRVCEKSFR